MPLNIGPISDSSAAGWQQNRLKRYRMQSSMNVDSSNALAILNMRPLGRIATLRAAAISGAGQSGRWLRGHQARIEAFSRPVSTTPRRLSAAIDRRSHGDAGCSGDSIRFRSHNSRTGVVPSTRLTKSSFSQWWVSSRNEELSFIQRFRLIFLSDCYLKGFSYY